MVSHISRIRQHKIDFSKHPRGEQQLKRPGRITVRNGDLLANMFGEPFKKSWAGSIAVCGVMSGEGTTGRGGEIEPARPAPRNGSLMRVSFIKYDVSFSRHLLLLERMNTVKAGILYFVLVFAAGWVLGPLREFWLIPLVGQRAGLLTEVPLMVLAMIAAARWTIRKLGVPYAITTRTIMGVVALSLLLIAEAVGVRWARQLSWEAYLARFDIVTGSITALSFVLYAGMPMLVKRRE